MWGLIDPIIIAPTHKINAVAQAANIDLSAFTLIDVPHSDAAAEMAVALVHQGRAEAIMKGSLHTDELMRVVVKRDKGLRTERRISHVFVMARESYHKPFIITDAAININPDLMTKRDIVQNAIDLTRVLNKDITPKVGILSAVETINPEIQSTIDAACLCKMAERGQITGAIVDGPFAYDNVISVRAAKAKNIESTVIGDVDIYLVPNLEAGNMLAKQLAFLTGAFSAGMILGAKVPIVLTSRSDGVRISHRFLCYCGHDGKRQKKCLRAYKPESNSHRELLSAGFSLAFWLSLVILANTASILSLFFCTFSLLYSIEAAVIAGILVSSLWS